MMTDEQKTNHALARSLSNAGLAIEREYDIAPELKHCQQEIDKAANDGNIEELKAIFKREGVEWVDHQPCGK